MERRTYLEICQLYNITKQQTVIHDGFEWYPKALEITFNGNGEAVYSTKLISKTARHSVCYAKLENVYPANYVEPNQPVELLRSKNYIKNERR